MKLFSPRGEYYSADSSTNYLLFVVQARIIYYFSWVNFKNINLLASVKRRIAVILIFANR